MGRGAGAAALYREFRAGVPDGHESLASAACVAGTARGAGGSVGTPRALGRLGREQAAPART